MGAEEARSGLTEIFEAESPRPGMISVDIVPLKHLPPCILDLYLVGHQRGPLPCLHVRVHEKGRLSGVYYLVLAGRSEISGRTVGRFRGRTVPSFRGRTALRSRGNGGTVRGIATKTGVPQDEPPVIPPDVFAGAPPAPIPYAVNCSWSGSLW